MTLRIVGTGESPASVTRFMRNATLIGTVQTPVIPAGGKATVAILWNTKGLKGTYTLWVNADLGNAIEELIETNNAGKLAVTVKADKVSNGIFRPSP
ncbi:MAG: CARDB domain-containing protein [Chloroflexota bacterium]